MRSQFKDRPEGCGVSQREGNGKGESCGSSETGIPQEKLCKHIYEALKLDLTKRSIKFALGLGRKEKNPDCLSQGSIQNRRGANW